jgi:hypothetical protein
MCVPGPGLLAEEGPRAWPGSVRVGVDIVVLGCWFGCGGVGECNAVQCDRKVHFGKS